MAEDRFRLLFIMHDRPDYPGGVSINYLRLLPRLAAMGHAVHLLACYYGDYPTAKRLSADGVHVYPLRLSLLPTVHVTRWIVHKIVQIQPDVFIPDVSTAGCFAGQCVRESGRPVITTLRSNDEVNWGRALYFTDPDLPYRVSGVVCVGRYLHDELLRQRASPELLTAVIPSGVSLPQTVSVRPGDRLRLVYAGRLVEQQKRILETMAAFIRVCRLYPDVDVTIIGEGPESARCREMVAAAGLEGRIHFTGMLLDDAYKHELAHHHAIVLLSDWEGVSGALMDGMSCGLVPISMDFEGVEELVDDEVSGLLVSDRNSSFDRAIERLRSEPALWAALSSNARRRIEQAFSIDTTVERWQAFLEQCRLAHPESLPIQRPLHVSLPAPSPLLPEYRTRSAVLRRLSRLVLPSAAAQPERPTGSHDRDGAREKPDKYP